VIYDIRLVVELDPCTRGPWFWAREPDGTVGFARGAIDVQAAVGSRYPCRPVSRHWQAARVARGTDDEDRYAEGEDRCDRQERHTTAPQPRNRHRGVEVKGEPEIRMMRPLGKGPPERRECNPATLIDFGHPHNHLISGRSGAL
jgi:hypothetical protein